MTPSLGERIEAARRSRFVGRTAECDLFRQAVTAGELPFFVLHIYGPGGIGKTTLLHQFAHLAREAQAAHFYVDSRELDPSPERFVATLQAVVNSPPGQTLFQFLAAQDRRYVILLDTAELLTPIDGWLRNTFFPQLPANILTVLAGRHQPAVEWRTDPGWQAFVRILQLRNLALEESQSYLARRQVPTEQHRPILDFTHGHPLALSLLADTFAQATNLHFQPAETPNIITALIERFVDQAPSATHRTALEACALVRVMTEPLLAEMMDVPDIHEIFSWLRTLSFMEVDRRGIFPHDLARDALCLELRWRNPARYSELHSHARRYYMAHFAEGNRQQQQNVLFDYIYLHRENPVVRPYFEWQERGGIFLETMAPADRAPVLDLIEKHEGSESAGLAEYWMGRQPHNFLVFRDANVTMQGVLFLLALDQAREADLATDPAVWAIHGFLRQHAPLRTGECATFFRFWLAADSYQAVSPVQSRIFLTMVQHYLTTPGLAYTFVPCIEPDFWTGVFAYADLHRLTTADYTIGGRTYGIYGHDWRVMPPLAWLHLLAEREIAMGIPRTAPPTQQPTKFFLSESDFAEAVRDALRDFHNAVALRRNPLLRSNLMERHGAGEGEPSAQLGALRTLLQTTALQLQQTPRNNKLYRALYHTYLQPAATQEQAAELLDLPFSTYRRHLRSGIDYLIETLWQQELEQLTG